MKERLEKIIDARVSIYTRGTAYTASLIKGILKEVNDDFIVIFNGKNDVIVQMNKIIWVKI